MPQQRDARKTDRILEAREALQAHEADPRIGAFLTLLLQRGSAEDILDYSPAALGAIARSAFDMLEQRAPVAPKVRVFNPDAALPGLERLANVTIVEILNDNKPFLVDSAMGELTDSGHDVRLMLHPVLSVGRDADGRLVDIHGAAVKGDGRPHESLIHIHIGRVASQTERGALADRLAATMADVGLAVRDWRPMVVKLHDAIAQFTAHPPALPKEEVDEALAFLRWMADDNFTFLGVRDYVFQARADGGELQRADDEGLGVLSDPNVRVLRRGTEFVTSTPEMAQFLMSSAPLIVMKANVRSRVHRRVHMDYIGVKLFDAAGKLIGERRFLGLFTSTAYTRSTKTIPYLRRKVDRAIERAGFDPAGHSGKTLLNVLESYPRDELFQVDEPTLDDFALQILALDEHPRVRVLARRDPFDRFVSILAFVPRERYSTDIRVKMGDLFARVYDGRVSAWYPAFLEGALTRVHFVIGRYSGATPNPSQEELESAVSTLVRSFDDALAEALAAGMAADLVGGLVDRYRGAFTAGFRERTPIDRVVADIRVIEGLSETRRIAIDFTQATDASPERVGLRLYAHDASIPLSDRVPVIENLGLKVIEERTHVVEPKDAAAIHIHDMTLEHAGGQPIALKPSLDALLEALFLAVWHDRAENDGFNKLGLLAGLGWREIAVVRALARYLRQAGIPYSQDYMWSTLARFPVIAALIADFFRVRFDPDLAEGDRTLKEAQLGADIDTALEAVSSLDDDRIIRRLVGLVRATVRTNVFQIEADGTPRRTFAFKFNPRLITDLPQPVPYREIWVYGPRVEGVHLRFGPVARGGLRWSDRAQDFRTEVLGLVKAQQVKNAVIVPMGAKGGFVPKRLPPPSQRDAWLKEGTEAYKVFVGSLLTVTDNIDKAALVPPPRVVRHDGDDPYLVVAADKGTATFSDTANGLSEAHGFWLGDAFASGGSAGYDHKKMGITARGGWEAVKRHFREMDIDIQTTPFTVAGVGDMSGDVFGNGMLLSKAIRLVAAFDHRDIFLDPNPDLAKSFAERQRLFALPRSSWVDYDASLISPGGGIFSRAAKSIPLSPQVQALIGIAQAKATPAEVMHAILKMKVDLLWFGGIGTYARAPDETDAEVGDRANDAIRVVASELRAKVIGEGANLGLTQRARIAFARRGGRCNSDAIDNSAGVNSSDVEVNIKIAFRNAMETTGLTRPSRDQLLAAMTDEVAGLVLANNYRQTLAISLVERRGVEDFGYQCRLMRQLEAAGELNRAVEALPTDAELANREKAGEGLSRPEIGVLLAYAKLALKAKLLASTVPDDTALDAMLMHYFPSAMRGDYAASIASHRLRREIIATVLTNAMIDAGGPTLATRIADRTGADAADSARAFVAANAVFGLDSLTRQIDALDAKVPGALQMELYGEVQSLLIDGLIWMVRHAAAGVGARVTIDRFKPAHDNLAGHVAAFVPDRLAEAARAREARLATAGVPDALARRIAYLGFEAAIPDIALVAEKAGQPLAVAAASHFQVAERFEMARLADAARSIAVRDYFDGLALDRARAVLADAHRTLAVSALAHPRGLDGWVGDRPHVARTVETINDILKGAEPTVSRFSVAAGLLADLTRG